MSYWNLNLLGFEIRSDETYDWYNKLLEEYILKLGTEADLDEKQEIHNEYAFNFYLDLEVERRLNGKKKADY